MNRLVVLPPLVGTTVSHKRHKISLTLTGLPSASALSPKCTQTGEVVFALAIIFSGVDRDVAIRQTIYDSIAAAR